MLNFSIRSKNVKALCQADYCQNVNYFFTFYLKAYRNIKRTFYFALSDFYKQALKKLLINYC